MPLRRTGSGEMAAAAAAAALLASSTGGIAPAVAARAGAGTSAAMAPQPAPAVPPSQGSSAPHAPSASEGPACRVARIAVDLDASFVASFESAAGAAEAAAAAERYAREALREADGAFAPAGVHHEVSLVIVRSAAGEELESGLVADLPARATRMGYDEPGDDDGASLLAALRDDWTLPNGAAALFAADDKDEVDAVVLFTARPSDFGGGEATQHDTASFKFGTGAPAGTAAEDTAGADAVGVAWVGGVCTSHGRFAAVRRLATQRLTADVVAHELGHLWGAAHCLDEELCGGASPQGFATMWPSAKGALRFSEGTLDVIRARAAAVGWCLETSADAHCLASAEAAAVENESNGAASAGGHCAGRCGSPVPVFHSGGAASCQCDVDCTSYGDCCADICASCGSVLPAACGDANTAQMLRAMP